MTDTFVYALITALVLGATFAVIWYATRGNLWTASFGIIVVLIVMLSFQKCV